MTRDKNWTLLDATHRLLWDDHSLTVAQLASRLAALGYRYGEGSVQHFIKELRDLGILGRTDRRPRLPPLYAGYLITDVPLARLAEVEGILERHHERVRELGAQADFAAAEVDQLPAFLRPAHQIDLLLGWLPALVRTRGSKQQMDELKQELDSAGGEGTQLFLVSVPHEERTRPRRVRASAA